MGTPAFMAPEQADDSHKADARADVYGLGCTLYYLLTGRAPFDGATALEVALAHREKPVPPLPSAPPGVEAFLRTALAKRPEDRFPTMSAAVAELEQALGRRRALRKTRGTLWRLAAAAVVLITAGIVSWAFVDFESRRAGLPPFPSFSVEVPRAPDNDPPEVVPPPRRTELDGAVARRARQRERLETFLHQSTVAARPLLPVAVVSALPRTPKIEMAPIGTGKFFMGSTDATAPLDEKPRVQVEITRRFEMGKFEVTQAQFEEVMGTNPSFFSAQNNPGMKGLDTRRNPVESVRWIDAVRFCNRLSIRHGLPPYYTIDGERVGIRGGSGYRLPTEAEWEYACRAGTSTRWSFGDDATKLSEFAWFSGNSDKRTHPVGEKRANPWGLYDMYGNVPEWCWDWYQADALRNAPEIDPPGPGTGTARVFRGGAWNARPEQTRSSMRHMLGMVYGDIGSPNHIGFRVARNLEP
jgi:formylglycine-generating enzyme required for sulfatase activity